MEYDFGGYVTRNNLKCSDGLTIKPNAFRHCDGMTVPLVYQHGHMDPENVLGHVKLENRDDGVYGWAKFNNTPKALHTKETVSHKDITQLSIYANQLRKSGDDVIHGSIREVSLVMAGANPGAVIDFVAIRHSDGDVEYLDNEAVVYTPSEIELAHAEDDSTEEDGKTVQEVFDTLNDEQKTVVYAMIAEALDSKTADDSGEVAQSDSDDDDLKQSAIDGDNTIQEGNTPMTRNVFESGSEKTGSATLTHSQLQTIVEDAKKLGSFKESFLMHAEKYGIENIDILFPDAKALANTPELISRRMEWVSRVINGTKHSPFSRIKSLSADITHEEARAKGYIKGNLKKNEYFGLATRKTGPTTIYKKQKLDRDDIIDITDLDVVAWLKAEMRIMLDEEIARAVLVGDGREIDDPDKIDEQSIRPIAHDDDFYAHKVVVPADLSGDALAEAFIRSRKYYKGAGNPTMFCHEDVVTDLLLLKDKMGRRLYPTLAELASALRVSDIVDVPIMEDVSNDGGEVIAILVNLQDYTIGADRGGNVSMFDDFDIDYNQYKYLIEGRMSGALTRHKTAIVYSRAAGTKVQPAVPSFDPASGTITIPTVTGVQYFVEGQVTANGTAVQVPAGQEYEVEARPREGYYFPHNTDADWDFTGPTGA